MTTSIQILCLNPNQLHMINLTPFIRHQITTHVLYHQDFELFEKEDTFVDDWDDLKKKEVEQHLNSTVLSNGRVIIASQNEELIGFSCLEPNLFEGYVELSFIHVSKPYRHLGIGARLFEATKKEALNMGADKLYIAAHPSIESQSYYKKMGCTLATFINEEIYRREPLDLQLEFDLSQN